MIIDLGLYISESECQQYQLIKKYTLKNLVVQEDKEKTMNKFKK